MQLQKNRAHRNMGKSQPSTSLLLSFWLFPEGSARAAAKAKGLPGAWWPRRTPKDGTNMGGLIICCPGKHGHGKLQPLLHRTAQNSRCLNDTKEMPKITAPVVVAQRHASSQPACPREHQHICGGSRRFAAGNATPHILHPQDISPTLLCQDLLFRWKLFKAQCLQVSPGYCQALGMSQEL